MKRVETSEATRSRGGDGTEPERSPGSTWSVVALVSEGTGDVGRAKSLVHKGVEGRQHGGRWRETGRVNNRYTGGDREKEGEKKKEHKIDRKKKQPHTKSKQATTRDKWKTTDLQ